MFNRKTWIFLIFFSFQVGPKRTQLRSRDWVLTCLFFYLTSVRPKKPISGGPSRMNERNFIAEFRNRVNVLGPWENMDPGHMNVLPTSHFSSTQRACQGRKGRFRRHSVRFWESILEPKRWKIWSARPQQKRGEKGVVPVVPWFRVPPKPGL